MMLARLMRFYPGLSVADYDGLPLRRLDNLVAFMDAVAERQSKQRG